MPWAAASPSAGSRIRFAADNRATATSTCRVRWWTWRRVAAEFGIDPERLTQHGHRAGPAKAVALDLACRLTDSNQREIGGYYGGITSMAVCMARRRLEQDPRYTNPAMRGRIAAIEAALRERDCR
jgi:hypothetical protein